ncbi:MAG: hypothetical protein A2W91_14000 [Bacteroidetes bacterium GWF2_38_335]|nr:MAG: hypothetical protein A2W91_14000 [Bacteroidetes bacterium GWF2_38_335]OFY77827.1 MAG: hypothetical protein A2281_15690 [Bacteroidetes bacterium RIFOXYA12_FULL_38_20]HBS87365.1 hypothetical protein [Bacteroidales bacterium]
MKKLFLLAALLIAFASIQAQIAPKYVVSLAGATGDEVRLSVNQIIDAAELGISPAGAQVAKFTIEYTEGGTTKTLSATGKTITKDMKGVISKMTVGQSFTIKDVTITEKVATSTLKTMKVIIKEDVAH